MVSQQALQGNWNEFKGKIKQRWGQLSNDELQQFDGNVDRLVGLIQRKTGEAKESVEEFLTQMTGNGATMVSQVTERAQEFGKQAVDSVRHGYEEAEKTVKERPVESVVAVFGTGLLVGMLVGVMFRSR